MRMRFVLSAVAVVALAVPVAWATTSGGVAAPPAKAAPAPALAADAMVRPAGAPSAVVAPAAAPATPRAAVYFVFVKNRHNPSNSTLILFEKRPNRPIPLQLGKWRAGSGIGTAQNKAGRNACIPFEGWLPNGWYDGVAHYAHFHGTKVFGLVWQLQDKRCSNNTPRTELFIHSEMTPSQGQMCKPGHYRQDQCWDGAQDYLSNGCIKLRPADIKAADRLFRNHSGTGYGTKRYPGLLQVTGG